MRGSQQEAGRLSTSQPLLFAKSNSKGQRLSTHKHATTLQGPRAKMQDTCTQLLHAQSKTHQRHEWVFQLQTYYIAKPQYKESEDLRRDRFIYTYIEECYPSKLIINETIVAPCWVELFCTSYVCIWLEQHNTYPGFDKPIVASFLVRPIKVLAQMITN